MVEQAIGKPICAEKLDKARKMAESKREGLTRRFGDAGGERRKDWYLAYLIIEQLCSDSLSKITQDLWEFEHDIEAKKE